MLSEGITLHAISRLAKKLNGKKVSPSKNLSTTEQD